MGKGKRIRQRKLDGLLHRPVFHGRDRIPGPDAPCAGCGKRSLYYLSTAVGILRCDCGWQGVPCLQDPDGRSWVMVPGEEGRCAATILGDGVIVIELALGPCRIEPHELGLAATHSRGQLIYSPWGHLIMATGVFVGEHLMAPRPPPCQCGSFHVEWLDGERGQPLIADVAEQLGRKVEPIRCMGRVYTTIEGVGGRAALCLACGMGRVFPTICEEESAWRREVEAKKQSVFVSYGGPDEAVAARIVHALKKKGVRTWFFPEDAVAGEKLHRTMFNGVNGHDRMLLVCSRASLARPGVLNEIERALERESREGGTTVLLPVTLDRHVFSEWAPSRPDLAQQVRDRVISDFSEAVLAGWSFHDRIDRLVEALGR